MPTRLYPRLTLALLTGLNILNYIDRSVLWAVQPLVKDEFKVTDAQIGLLTTTFFWFYMCAAPIIGYLGDRYSRRHIVAVGIMIWSGFTFLTAITHTFNELMLRHILVGIGEASYASIAPTLVADLFPLERRGRMLAIFSAGLPFGTAVGYLLGGIMGQLRRPEDPCRQQDGGVPVPYQQFGERCPGSAQRLAHKVSVGPAPLARGHA